MKYHSDNTFDIATGQSRRETSWKNKEILWSDLVKKLKTTHRTAETFAEYMSAKKVRQDEIKDIGGFVGGYLTGGKRRASSVLHRQLVTLDIDFGTHDTWGDFSDLYDCAACMYSTHKHSSEAPRLRLLLPLSREVFPDEYVAIARRVAGNIGIEAFDDTTFQPERLMYWPSTAKDGEFIFEYQDGPRLDVDEVLSTYRNWKDSSEWPVSQRQNTIIERTAKKQGDPLEKPGVIGAFCRTYSIAEAIDTFLPDQYEECATPDRYSYKHGSTAGGLVIYNGIFGYSHHGTDPVSGKLCNAFDLVRIHKFGHLDDDVTEGTKIEDYPSFKAAKEFAAADTEVKKQINIENLKQARGDFDGIAQPGEEAETLQLEIDRTGKVKNNIQNAVTILKNDTDLKGLFVLNLFESREEYTRRPCYNHDEDNSLYFTDRCVANVKYFISNKYKVDFSNSTIDDALKVIFTKNPFHPVRDYLNVLQWDGKPRIDGLLIEYLGAEDSEYVRAATKKSIVACVARIFKPGKKFDHVLTLIGDEGKGKSTLLRKLGRQWFSDTFNLHMLQSKQAYEQIRGAWIIEISELAGAAKVEVESVKGFISAQEDRYRQAYGRKVESYPRQCVFFATTNKTDFLRSQTGNRRFWPVRINKTLPAKSVFTDLTEDVIDQVWAEAVQLFKKGEPLFLSHKLEQVALQIQSEHTETDERHGEISIYLEKLLPANWEKLSIENKREFLSNCDVIGVNYEKPFRQRTKVCVAEIMTEKYNYLPGALEKRYTGEIHNIMRRMPGWKEYGSKLKFRDFGSARAYVRNDEKKVADAGQTVAVNKER